MSSQYNSESTFFYNVFNQYKTTTDFDSSRIRQDLTKEQSTSKDYKGREIYELIQNAEDEKSEAVCIILDTKSNKLIVANKGKECSPFTKEGFCSIMMAEMSPKMVSKRTYIGSKGLGFRSLINWAEQISIYSGGVCCTFSRKIAKSYWKKLTEIWMTKGVDTICVQKHEDFALQQFDLDSPLPMLSVPEVNDFQLSDYTTSIEVIYKQGCRDSIIDQLTCLSGKVLLFLQHIQTIDIKIDEQSIRLSKQLGEKASEELQRIFTFDKGYHDGQEWLLYKKSGILGEDKKYDISLAFNPTFNESGEFIYSFFPTKVRMSLPLVLHATFELNSSRNSINESENNNEMQRLLAVSLVEFSQLLAKYDLGEPSWIYYDITNLTQTSEQKEFEILFNELNSIRNTSSIFPTIGAGYLPYNKVKHYDEAFAHFLIKNKGLYEENMFNHLIECYNDRHIPNQVCDDELESFVNAFSYSMKEIEINQVELRASFIASLYRIKQGRFFKVLVDEDNDIIEKEARNNVGESIPHLPQEMNIRYVSDSLIKSLEKSLQTQEDSNPRRAVTQRLKMNSCADVSDMDINLAKRSIISYSKNSMSLDGFEQLMYALFQKYLESERQNDYKEMFMHHDFKVINAEGNKCFPCEVVLCNDTSEELYDKQFQLRGTAQYWSDIFSMKSGKNHDIKDVNNFFINVVGVSSHIPKDYLEFDHFADKYLNKHCIAFKDKPNQFWRYRSSSFPNYFANVNWYKIAKRDFINSALNKENNLAKVILLFKQDKDLIKELRNTDLWYSYNGTKKDEVNISYALYQLRSWDIFQPLQTYIVSEHLCLTADALLENQLNDIADDYEIMSLLILLGAKARLSNLSNEELYDILRILPNKHLEKGVRPIYKAIREAIMNNQNRANLSDSIGHLADKFKKEGLVYARKNGGALSILPVNEVYYWDNEQMPKQLLQSKWKLEIGNRVGEKSVKEIFGVKLANEIEIHIDNNIPNNNLRDDVVKCLKERHRYILAYRFHNSRNINEEGKSQIAGSLKNIRLNIYQQCSYTNDGEQHKMADGDMVTQNEGNGIIFHICAYQQSFAEAIKSPIFCENMMEVICMTLKVTSNEMANAFRSILKNTEEENKYISDKDILDEEWSDVEKALGLSHYDKVFWGKVGISKGISIDTNKLCQDNQTRKDYLQGIFPNIVLPEYYYDLSHLTSQEKYALLLSLELDDTSCMGKDALYEFYETKLSETRNKYRNSYLHHIFELINRDSLATDKAKVLYDKIISYDSTWLDSTIEECSTHVIDDHKIFCAFSSSFENEFQISISNLTENDAWSIPSLPNYIEIMKELNIDISTIDQCDLCMTCFEGYEEKFKTTIQKSSIDNSDLDIYIDNEDSLNKLPQASINFGNGFNKPLSKDSKSYPKKGGKGYQSERSKIKAGRLAEKLVFEAMIADNKRFSCVEGCSKNLNPIGGRDDLHYDIKYNLLNSPLVSPRFLEVKSMSSDSIIMSYQEYEFAKNNKSQYDLALVQGNDITFLLQPFVEKEGRPALKVYTDTYKISFTIETDKE